MSIDKNQVKKVAKLSRISVDESKLDSLSNDLSSILNFVEQLNKDDSVLARYEFFNMFPTSIGAIDLSYETVDALETFDVEFQYSHWERVV